MVGGRTLVVVVATLALVGFALRIAYAWPGLTNDRPTFHDEADYIGPALAMSHAVDPVAILQAIPAKRLPFTSSLMAAADMVLPGPPGTWLWAWSAMSAATIPLVFVAGRQVAGVVVGVIAAGLWAVNPMIAAWTGALLLSDGPFVATGLAFIVCQIEAVRRRSLRWALAASVAVALFTVTRPNAVPVIGVVLLWSFWQLRHDRRARAQVLVPVVCGVLILWLPWSVRNYLLTGRVIPLTDQACPPCAGLYQDRVAYPDEWWQFGEWAPLPEPADVADSVAYRRALAWAWILNHPLESVAIALAQVIHTWRHSGLWTREYAIAFHYTLSTLALVGLVLSWRRWNDAAGLWLALALVTTLFAVVTIGSPRFRFLVEPVLMIFAAMTLTRLAAAARVPRLRPLPLPS